MPKSSPKSFPPAICAALLIFVGCREQDPSSHSAPAPEASPLEISLNEGKKWQTDEHTRMSIQRMKNLVQTTPPDSLGSALAGEINRLFAGCKMEGEAHNQLHIFLGELLIHVNGLYSSETQPERAAEIEAIETLLTQYHAYFE